MKQKYFLYGTLWGLFLGIPLVGFLIGGKGALLFVVTPQFLLPLAFGYGCAIVVARFADNLISSPPGFLKTLLGLESTFISGVLGGSLANLLVNGKLQSPSFGLWNEAWSWFGKPAFWTLYIGVPSAAVVALSYYALMKWTRNQEQN